MWWIGVGSILALKILTDIKTRTILENMNKERIKKYWKISSSSYPLRSSNNQFFTQTILYIWQIVYMIICHYPYYLYFAKLNEIFVPKREYIYEKSFYIDLSSLLPELTSYWFLLYYRHKEVLRHIMTDEEFDEKLERIRYLKEVMPWTLYLMQRRLFCC